MSDFEKEYYEADEFWEGHALQDENNVSRIKETAAMIPADAASLADIGCGNGVFVNYLQQRSPALALLAIDRSRAALKHVMTEKKEGDIAAIPLTDRSFDCVTCLEVIEHLPVSVYRLALSELTRVARRYVIVSVPYAERLEQSHTQCPQCTSIFNSDLHLRTFSDETMRHLLDDDNFECVSTRKAGEQTAFKGHFLYTKLFYPKQFRLWRSPICPICGYGSGSEQRSSAARAQVEPPPVARHRSIRSLITWLPKLFWPKEHSYYWIIALYRRK